MKNAKCGRFFLSQDTIEAWPRLVMFLMSRMIVVRCECLWANRGFSYDAICDDFRPADENCEIPFYELEVEDGHVYASEGSFPGRSLQKLLVSGLTETKPGVDGKFGVWETRRAILLCAHERIEVCHEFARAFAEATMIGKGMERAQQIATETLMKKGLV